MCDSKTYESNNTKTYAVNIRSDVYDVRIDRKTKWGNPFPMRSEKDRTKVIAQYRDWLWQQIKSGQITLEELAALHGKRLACHCAPKACHGDVLAAAATLAFKQLRKAA
jgi:hypothetical protein